MCQRPHSTTAGFQRSAECARLRLHLATDFVRTAVMAVLKRLGGAHGFHRNVAVMASAASRLLRAYTTQVESLRRLRNGGSQLVRVEHVHVNDGGGRSSVQLLSTGHRARDDRSC